VINPKISVVLNVFKRSKYFKQQLESIKSQSITPFEILVWENGQERVPENLRNNLIIARSSYNLGVWARFAYALNCTGDYICILDDDTIPGSRWLENCYQTILETPALLGTRGLVFQNALSYSLNFEVGVYAPNAATKRADIVGHSWFFKKEWLSAYWFEANNKFDSLLAGEDIHFSYALQKNLDIPTLVPPHPENKLEFWGSSPKLAKEYGSGFESISTSKDSLKRFESALQHYRKLGFKTISELENIDSLYPNPAYWLTQKFPSMMHEISRKTKRLRDQ